MSDLHNSTKEEIAVINKRNISFRYTPSTASVGVLFIPGISGDALSERWNFLEEEITKAHFHFLRFNGWKNQKELEELTLSDVYSQIDYFTKFLYEQGCESVVLLAKSFGGCLSLAYLFEKNDETIKSEMKKAAFKKIPEIAGLICLASPVSIKDTESISRFKTETFSHLNDLFDFGLTKEMLAKMSIPVLFIHGTKDEVISIENSKRVCSLLPDSELIAIEDADHSYEKKEEELVHALLPFLESFM